MIVLVNSDVLAARADEWASLIPGTLGPRSHVLERIRGEPATGGRWRNVATERRQSLPEWLKTLLVRAGAGRAQENLVCFVWTTPDEDLWQLIEFLSRQSDYRVAASVLLIKPLPQDPFLAEFAKRLDSTRQQVRDREKALHDRRVQTETEAEPPAEDLDRVEERRRLVSLVRSLVYLGHENQERQPISEDSRHSLVFDYLRLLTTADDAVVNALDVFGSDRSSLSTDQPIFWAFGLRSWCRAVETPQRLAQSLANAVLIEQLRRQNEKRTFSEDTLRQSPASLLNQSRLLELPRDDASGGSQPTNYRDRLSYPPQHPFSRWFCPIIRELAMPNGNDLISKHLRALSNHQALIKSELGSIASDIRKHGQGVFRRTVQTLREWLKPQSSLAQIADLLRLYFPEFEKLRRRQSVEEKRPCRTATRELTKEFGDDMREALKKNAVRVPLMRTYIIVGLFTVLMLLVALGVFHFLHNIPSAAWIAGFGIVPFLGLVAWGTLSAMGVKKVMAENYDAHQLGLYQEHQQKIDWVTDSTQRILEAQIIADAWAIRARLQADFENIFANWQSLVDEPSNTAVVNTLKKLGINDDEIRELRDEVESVGPAMMSLSVGEFTEALKHRVDRFTATLATRLAALMTSKIVPHQTVHDDVFACTKPFNPVLMTRLSETQAREKLLKVFVIPHQYPDNWQTEFERDQPGLTMRCVRDRINGPLVWVGRRGLDTNTVISSLRTTEIVT